MNMTASPFRMGKGLCMLEKAEKVYYGIMMPIIVTVRRILLPGSFIQFCKVIAIDSGLPQSSE